MALAISPGMTHSFVMSVSKPDNSGFIHELRRRRVLPAAVAYTVGAWALLEALDLMLDAFGASGAVMPIIIIAAALGFPVAIALAWTFDISIKGVSRTGDDPGDWNDVVAADSLAPERRRRLKQIDLVLVSCLPIRNANALDPEDLLDMRHAIEIQFAQIAGKFGGIPIADPGLELQAAFGYPKKRRDDLRRAIDCAKALSNTVFDLPAGLADLHGQAAQVGLHAGPVLVPKWGTSTKALSEGAVLGRTARFAVGVARAAPPGQVLASAQAERLDNVARWREVEAREQESETTTYEFLLMDQSKGG